MKLSLLSLFAGLASVWALEDAADIEEDSLVFLRFLTSNATNTTSTTTTTAGGNVTTSTTTTSASGNVTTSTSTAAAGNTTAPYSAAPGERVQQPVEVTIAISVNGTIADFVTAVYDGCPDSCSATATAFQTSAIKGFRDALNAKTAGSCPEDNTCVVSVTGIVSGRRRLRQLEEAELRRLESGSIVVDFAIEGPVETTSAIADVMDPTSGNTALFADIGAKVTTEVTNNADLTGDAFAGFTVTGVTPSAKQAAVAAPTTTAAPAPTTTDGAASLKPMGVVAAMSMGLALLF